MVDFSNSIIYIKVMGFIEYNNRLGQNSSQGERREFESRLSLNIVPSVSAYLIGGFSFLSSIFNKQNRAQKSKMVSFGIKWYQKAWTKCGQKQRSNRVAGKTNNLIKAFAGNSAGAFLFGHDTVTSFLSLFRTASAPAFLSASRHDSGTRKGYITVGSLSDKGARCPLSAGVMVCGMGLLILHLYFAVQGFIPSVFYAKLVLHILRHLITLALDTVVVGRHQHLFFAFFGIKCDFFFFAIFCVLFHFLLLVFGLFISLLLVYNIINRNTIVNSYFDKSKNILLGV